MNYTLHRIADIVKNHLIYNFTTAMSARFFTLYKKEYKMYTIKIDDKNHGFAANEKQAESAKRMLERRWNKNVTFERTEK